MFNVILKVSAKGISKSRAKEIRGSLMHVRAGDGCGKDTRDQGS